MKNSFLGYFKCFLLFLLALTLDVNAASNRGTNQAFVRLPGHIPDTLMAKSNFLERLNADESVPMTFVLPLRNQKALEKLVKRIHDPSDQKYYGKYLSTEEFMEKFAPTQKDYDEVIAYAKDLGFSINGTHSNRTLLNVLGSANSVEAGFNLGLREYGVKGERKLYGPDNNPEVPMEIANIISGVVGLDNLAVWHPYHHIKLDNTKGIQAKAPFAYPSGPGRGFAPHDLEIAYNLTGVHATGLGQNVALFQLASYQEKDINQYTTFFGLPPAKLTNVLVDGGSTSGINAEVTLDIELVLALAPDSHIYVYEGPNTNQGVLDTYNRIATDNIAKQVSTSWGLGEGLVSSRFLEAENAIFLQMAAHGQTIYAAAGDSGAYDNYPSMQLMVDDPASQPYIVGVGGTTLSVNPQNGSYVGETVWNDGFGSGAGGGGVSNYWPIPSWQANISTLFSKTKRNVPDISLNSDPDTGYSIYHDGEWVLFGGTSCAAPLWAGFTARVNQELSAKKQPALGFANPKLYAIGANSMASTNFYDIISGNNQYYPAKASYDNATGWGSFNGLNLFTTLTNSSVTPPPPVVSPALNIKMSHSSSFYRGGAGAYQINVSNQGNGSTSGAVTVTVALPAGLSYIFSSASGWSFNRSSMTFTRSNPLKPGESYPAITLYARVSSSAPSTVTAKATVSGGGSVSSTATDLTSIK